MSKTVNKLDGFAGVNELRKRFVSMYASEAIAKGDCVALDFSATEPTHGYGNHVRIARLQTATIMSSQAALGNHIVGVAAEAITSGEVGSIQVYGHCTFAKCSDIASAFDGGSAALSDSDEGCILTSSEEAGHFGAYDSSAAMGVGGDSFMAAILIEYGTADTADSTVWLLNPANL
tara:strand:- start:642 stop:1169 length:528 start_codon:yes stop_codon:yes gene_type:complete